MLEKNVQNRNQVEIICIEDLVPQSHLLRKIESAVDFKKIYDFVEDLYCTDNGRPSIDPVILFKMVLIQHLYITDYTFPIFGSAKVIKTNDKLTYFLVLMI